MTFAFEDLKVYKKSLRFSVEAIRLAKTVSKDNRTLADQLTRAASSIPLNIAEGNGRWHFKERLNFFKIARGSVFECVAIIDLLHGLGLISQGNFQRLKKDLDEVSRMISGLVNKSRNLGN